jgi:hypothetical protein
MHFFAAESLGRLLRRATGGSNANSGLSPATAWKTIAKVNASSFAAGDRILLKRGQVWRERLTVPSSGTAGWPIVFGAYGTGDRRAEGLGLVRDWTNQARASGGPPGHSAQQVFRRRRALGGTQGLDQPGSGGSSGVLYVYAVSTG